MTTSLLLNCDLGEGFGPWKMGADEVVMPYIHLANIACGFHASDPLIMDRTVALAKAHQVKIGAHPSYPDLVGFGRRSMACSHDEIVALVNYQVGALQAICRRHGVMIDYVKPHGALYNDMMKDEALLQSILQAVSECGAGVALMIMATPDKPRHELMAKAYRVPLLFEFFADRAYSEDGLLVARNVAGAVVQDAEKILARVKHLLATGDVITVSGNSLPVSADSICVHGDNPDSIQVTKVLRRLLDAA